MKKELLSRRLKAIEIELAALEKEAMDAVEEPDPYVHLRLLAKSITEVAKKLDELTLDLETEPS